MWSSLVFFYCEYFFLQHLTERECGEDDYLSSIRYLFIVEENTDVIGETEPTPTGAIENFVAGEVTVPPIERRQEGNELTRNSQIICLFLRQNYLNKK